jgi:hypothetical protein
LSSRGRWSLRIGAAIPVVLALLFSPSAAFAEEEEGIPTIDKESVSGITSTNAILEAQISPHSWNGADYQFQLVTDPEEYAPEILCPYPPSGLFLCLGPAAEGVLPIEYVFKEATPVSLDLSGEGVTLQPSTTYHYRVLAARSAITEDTIEWESPTVFGPDQTFTTPEEEPTGPTNRRTLTLTKSPSVSSGKGTGTVSSKPKGIMCGATCSKAVASLYKGANVALAAKPSMSSTFVEWTGACSGSSPTCTVKMDEAKEVGAVFAGTSKAFSPAEALTVSKGESTGQGVVKVYGSLYCEADCTETISYYQGPIAEKSRPGRTVVLEQKPAFGSEFSSWSGCDEVIEGYCVVAMESNRKVTAKYTALPTVDLAVKKSAYAGGAGKVTSKPKGINCAAYCTRQSAALPEGAGVTLTAKPGKETGFVEWQDGDCDESKSLVCTVTMDEAEEITAVFEGPVKKIAPAETLTLVKAGSGFGTVKAAGLACEALCTSVSALYQGPMGVKPGKTVILKAASAPGSKAVEWSGCDSIDAEGNCVVTMSSSREVTAAFDELE